MPDITMCKGGDCPLKEKCYRNQAPSSSFWQAYFVMIPYTKVHDSVNCEYFLPLEAKDDHP